MTPPEWRDTQIADHVNQAGLVEAVLDESVGGGGLGFEGFCVLMECFGRLLPRIPLLEAGLVALALARFSTPESAIGVASGLIPATLAMEVDPMTGGPGQGLILRRSDDRWLLSGSRVAVPAVQDGGRILLPVHVDDGRSALLFLKAPEELSAISYSTNGQPLFRLTFDGLPVEAGDVLAIDRGEAWGWLKERAYVAVSAIELGIVNEVIDRTAAYTATRQQFGRALAQFQAVAMKLADLHLDREVIGNEVWQAAWAVTHDDDSLRRSLLAKYWSADAGRRIVTTAQHLHGGMGADVDYGLEEFTRWSKHHELLYGSSSQVLDELGRTVAGVR